MKNILNALGLGLALVLWASTTAAEPPPRPDDWVAITPVTFCTVDDHDDMPGECRVFQDSTGEYWLVFWDTPDTILFIRSGVNGEYTYLYQRPAEQIGTLL